MPEAAAPEPEGRATSADPAQDAVPTAEAPEEIAPDDAAGAGPPPRPELGGAGFVATSAAPPMPSIVSTALGLWVGSLAAGLLAAGSVVRSQPQLRDRFAEEVVKADPTTTLATAQDAASVLVWIVVGALALVWLVHLVLVVRTAGGHGGARWGLVVLGVAGALTVLVLQDVIADPDASPTGDLNRVALLAQAVLALLGSVALALPAAGRWFKDVRRRR